MADPETSPFSCLALRPRSHPLSFFLIVPPYMSLVLRSLVSGCPSPSTTALQNHPLPPHMSLEILGIRLHLPLPYRPSISIHCPPPPPTRTPPPYMSLVMRSLASGEMTISSGNLRKSRQLTILRQVVRGSSLRRMGGGSVKSELHENMETEKDIPGVTLACRRAGSRRASRT